MTNPKTGELGTTVLHKDRDGNMVERGFGIMRAGAMGPPMHIHPGYTEYFEVFEGQAIFTLDGKKKLLVPGDKIVVSPDTPHTFSPHGDHYLAIFVDAHPTGKLKDIIATLFGLAHEGKTGRKGQPGFWQSMVMGAELSDDTVFTHIPPKLQQSLFKLFGPVGKFMGYEAIYERFLEERYWKKWVEQLELVS